MCHGFVRIVLLPSVKHAQKKHKTKRRYKSHTVVPRTYTVLRLFGPSKIAEQCRMHPEKEISTYCNKCDVPCCVSCLAKDHKRHDFSTIEDKYLDAEKGLNEYYRQLDTDIRPTLEEMEEQAKADAKDDDIHVERVVSDINNFRKDVVENFNQACDDLISEVINLQSNNQKRLEDITRAKNNVVNLKRKIEKKIERGKLDMVKYNPPNIESLVPHFTSHIKVVPWFEPDTKILELISESIGKIHLREIKQKRNADVSTRCRKPLNIQNIHSFNSKIGATSIIKSGNKSAWITDFGTSKMYLYNDLGEVVRSISVDGCDGINGIAMTQTGDMIVTCEDNKVRRVSESGVVETFMDTEPFECEGVCLTDKEEVVVCMCGLDDLNHVAVFSPDGRTKLREIRGRDSRGKYRITNPYCVKQNGQDLCVVNTNVVLCVDERDNVRWMYNRKHAKLRESFNPRGICVDMYNCLLITDNGNHCVHYVNREGVLIKMILTQDQTGLKFHWGICVDDVTGYVWVGNSSKHVVIAKYLE